MVNRPVRTELAITETRSNPARYGHIHRLFQMLVTGGVLPVLIVIMVVVFGIMEPRFLNSSNLINIVRQTTFLAIVSMGQMIALISAGFDLSIGAIVALTSVVTATTMVYLGSSGAFSIGMTITLGCVAGLIVGAVIGLANGIGVAVLRVSPFIVTLGTSSMIAGVALLMTGGAPITGLPSQFVEALGTARMFGIPVVVFVTAAIILMMYFIMSWSRFGRYIYAIGGNDFASRLSGISVGRYQIAVYVLSGVLASIAGVLLTARVSAGEPNLGGSFAMQSITAAVLGGTSLRGGEGKLGGTLLGALFITTLGNGMNLIRVSSFWQIIFLGALLIFAVVIDRLRNRFVNSAR